MADLPGTPPTPVVAAAPDDTSAAEARALLCYLERQATLLRAHIEAGRTLTVLRRERAVVADIQRVAVELHRVNASLDDPRTRGAKRSLM